MFILMKPYLFLLMMHADMLTSDALVLQINVIICVLP